MRAKFTFKETFEDLEDLYKRYDLEKATLIGHSFGGIITTLFAEKNPGKIHSLILVGAPVSLQESFQTIIHTCKALYTEKDDKINLNYLAILEKMDTNSLEYSSYCFMHAMQNNFYSPKQLSEEAKEIYSKFKRDTILAKKSSEMTYPPTLGFWKNEKYTSLDLTEEIKNLKEMKIKIYGLYGKDDGLYSVRQIEKLKELIGNENVGYFENCSHNVFMD